jgi:uncharacterized protein YutE (UPF0331/DUF86 family)
MTLSETRESDVLEHLLPQYQADGYDVYVNPSPSILPPFMQGYRPDAIAVRPDKKVAIEIVRSARTGSGKTEALQSLLADHPDWELRVVYVSPLSSQGALEIASQATIANAIQVVLELKDESRYLPALMMAWATLESIGRALLPDRFSRPQTPARLIEVLASEGYLAPDEADALRAFIPLRNAAVHGVLEPAIDEKQLKSLVGVLRNLVEFLPKETTPTRP